VNPLLTMRAALEFVYQALTSAQSYLQDDMSIVSYIRQPTADTLGST